MGKRILLLSLTTVGLISAQSRPAITKEIFDQWMTDLSNWNRWGKDDEMGAMNLITSAKRKQAARLVREGASFSLSRDAKKTRPPTIRRPSAIA
jgi:hypothetical protein